MKSNVMKLELTSVDDLFATQESREEAGQERVQEIPLALFHPFPNRPFQVRDDGDMEETVESVKLYGILVPALARPRPDGGYEIIAGQRRHRASELAQLDTLPTIVRDMDDDTAAIIMVDSNLQREHVLPSERAFAYKMKVEALKRQGQRRDLTSGQVVPRLAAREQVAREAGACGKQISRYIRLTRLVPPLLQLVDEKKVAFSPAVELSYLTPEEQEDLLEVMDAEQAVPSLSQAQRLKKLSTECNCTVAVMTAILNEEKKPEQSKVAISTSKLSRYFPQNYSTAKMEETILKLLESWSKQRAKSKVS